ncbi:MAG: bifunctional nuclease family protein [Elusimicrobiota bacterium]|nr:bifunctional nuclease family protein [Endomicrobiia bacterium]MDW8165372.1 bifunctional nuclease family protein [Elusimicrobiota bacterium]
MIKVKVGDLLFDEISQMGIVLLEEDIQESQQSEEHKSSDIKVLPIWIGMFEAQSIMFKLQNMFFPRPLTHDLLKNCIEMLFGKVKYIIITSIKDNTFYAEICIDVNNKEVRVDSRPSDAIALAIRCECPIYVNEEVMNLASVKKEEFIKEQRDKILRQILELSELEEENKLKH